MNQSPEIIIGKNAKDNWSIIDNANSDDYWYHLKSFSSAHVVCSDISKLYECALQCKQHSKFKNLHNVKIIYTQINNLIKGDKPGSVHFKSNRKVKTVYV